MEKERIINVYVSANSVCPTYGHIIETCMEGMGDIHTEGLKEFFNHKELQIVTLVPLETIGDIFLDLIGEIKNGKRIEAGMELTDILGGPKGEERVVKFMETSEGYIRVLLPDNDGLHLDDANCEYPFSAQAMPTSMICPEAEISKNLLFRYNVDEIEKIEEEPERAIVKVDLEEAGFEDGIAVFSTKGLDQFNHRELQIVIPLPENFLHHVLTEIITEVANGRIYEPGEDIEGLLAFPDGEEVAVKTEEIEDGYLRLIFPDTHKKYPENRGCQYPFSKQRKPLRELRLIYS